MEIKKSEKANLENKKLLFLEVGLILALAAVFVAFEWQTEEQQIIELEDTTQVIEVEEVIATQTETPPPPPSAPKMPVLSDQIDIVDDEIVVDDNMFLNLEDDVNMGVEIMDYVENVEEEVIEEEPPFLVAETMPSFQGGDLNAFRNWVQSKVRYPAIAQENGISGRVVLTFVIEKDGRLTNIQVLQTPDRSLSEEAVRVLQQSPKWSPGKQRNQPVRVKYTLPVDFRIQQ